MVGSQLGVTANRNVSNGRPEIFAQMQSSQIRVLRCRLQCAYIFDRLSSSLLRDLDPLSDINLDQQPITDVAPDPPTGTLSHAKWITLPTSPQR